ncbi:MAG: HPF/RaiA family ribosome-associated protein [Planctomycetota bacterium]
MYVRAVNFQMSEALGDHAERRLHAALDRYESRLGTVSLRLTDDHGPRHGTTMHCCIEAAVRGAGSVLVEQDAPDLFEAIDRAAGRMKRTVRRAINRRRHAQMRPSRALA